MTENATTDTARNASLEGLAALLQNHQARKLDMVVPAQALSLRGGVLQVQTGGDVEIDQDGVTTKDGLYRLTEDADAQLAERLGIPVKYLRRMREQRVDLLDANVNGWLHGWRDELAESFPQINPNPPAPIAGDTRSFLLRTFKGQGNEPGIARALLSDRYGIVDHLDVLMAALSGIRQAGSDVVIAQCDLTPRRMYVKVVAPGVEAYAPKLLEGYRSPFDGRNVGRGWTPQALARVAEREGKTEDTPPVVFAGFVLANSETGHGSWSITPQLQVRVCRNGLTITADAMAGVHLGGKLEDGVVRWSERTQLKALELVTSRAADAVATFLDVDYVTRKVATLEEKAGVEVIDPNAVIERVSKTLAFTEDQQATILAHFIRGGQLTAGGVMQAVTSAAQTQTNPDIAYDMEAAALRVLNLAAAH